MVEGSHDVGDEREDGLVFVGVLEDGGDPDDYADDLVLSGEESDAGEGGLEEIEAEGKLCEDIEHEVAVVVEAEGEELHDEDGPGEAFDFFEGA